MEQQTAAGEDRHTPIDPGKVYSLPELVDLAEQHNLSTRAAWENARAAAGRLGVARSDLLPALTAVALANTTREGALFGDSFVRQTLGSIQPDLELNFLVLDFGARSATSMKPVNSSRRLTLPSIAFT